jgi:hypothetical protein
MDFNDIPTIEAAGGRGRKPSPDAAFDGAYLAGPSALSQAFEILSTSVGTSMMRLLQNAPLESVRGLAEFRNAGPAAGATSPAWQTHYDCTVFNYNGTCTEACFGFAPHHMDPFYCATCAEQQADPANNLAFWHFVGNRGTFRYMDMEPDACYGKDAWKWKVGACGNCASSATFRCHDGYKKYPDSASWDPTICQGLVICDSNLNLC